MALSVIKWRYHPSSALISHMAVGFDGEKTDLEIPKEKGRRGRGQRRRSLRILMEEVQWKSR